MEEWIDDDQIDDNLWDTMIETEPQTKQDFIGELGLLLPREELKAGLWDVVIAGMKKNQKKLKGLKGHTLREAISIGENLD